MEIVKELKPVDLVLLYSDDKVLHALDKSDLIDIRFMGEDHKGRKHHPIKAKVVYISRNHDYSSSNIRKRL